MALKFGCEFAELELELNDCDEFDDDDLLEEWECECVPIVFKPDCTTVLDEDSFDVDDEEDDDD